MIESIKIFGALFASVFMQLLLTRHVEYFYFLDLPLVAVIYFATYKTRIQSSLIGSAAGLVQDSISGLPLGMNGFTKTLAGYLVAAICSRLIVSTFTAQFLLLVVMSLLDSTLKLILFKISDSPLSARFLNASILQALATGAVGSGILSGIHALSQWKRTR